MLIEGLVARLIANSAIAAIVGQRVQPEPAPEDLSLYPLITYKVASDVTTYNMQGEDGLVTCRVVFTCLGVRYGDARSTALAVKLSLSNFAGILSDGTPIDGIEIVNIADGFGDGSRVYRTAVHAMCRYNF
jgi:hypothetical protein